MQLMLGLVPDAPHGRCWCAPELPSWVPSLELNRVLIGEGRLSLRAVQTGGRTHSESLDAANIAVLHGGVEAPLWGQPLTL